MKVIPPADVCLLCRRAAHWSPRSPPLAYDQMESIHGSKGHKQSKLAQFLPSEREGVGLAVGSALLWCKLRDSSSASFFTKITDEVTRCMESDRTFSKEVMKHFVQNVIFGGIPQYAVEKWIQRECVLKQGDELVQFTKDTVENFLYRYLASVESGVGYDEAKDLCEKANLGEILRCKKLGGRSEWTLDDFLSRSIWTDLGGKAGIKQQSKTLLTIIAAAGRKDGPINPFCAVCKQLKFQHRGKRCDLNPIKCRCDVIDAEDVDVESLNPAPKSQKTSHKTSKRVGNMDALDPTGQGIKESHQRKVCTHSPQTALTCACHQLTDLHLHRPACSAHAHPRELRRPPLAQAHPQRHYWLQARPEAVWVCADEL